MSTFGDALKKGLGAVEKRRAAEQELEEVLAAVSRDASELFGTDLRFRVIQKRRESRLPTVFERMAGTEPPLITVSVIEVRAGHFVEDLADVEASEVVYPLRIRWENHVDHAADRAGFEAGMVGLLQSAVIAEKVSKLVAHATKEQQKSPGT